MNRIIIQTTTAVDGKPLWESVAREVGTQRCWPGWVTKRTPLQMLHADVNIGYYFDGTVRECILIPRHRLYISRTGDGQEVICEGDDTETKVAILALQGDPILGISTRVAIHSPHIDVAAESKKYTKFSKVENLVFEQNDHDWSYYFDDLWTWLESK